jgi:hypothetical protein
MKHQYHKCNKNDCFICEGGLLYCEVCHLGEVELVSDECAGGLTPLAVDLPTESCQPSWADDGLDDAVIGSLP